MADRWMDDRDRQWRDRDWRRSEQYGRGGETSRWGEDRSWSGPADDDRGRYGYSGRSDRDRDYGSRDYSEPSRLTSGGAAYGAETYRGESYRPDRSERFSSQDYTGGSFGGRSGRADYRADYGRDSGGRDESRSWDRDGDRSYNRDLERRYADDLRGSGSGGTGGYDYDRGYGDGGRGGERRGYEDRDRGGDFLQRASERISNWFRGENLMRGSRDQDQNQGEARFYREDFGRDERYIPAPGHRGRGPKGYKRSDERINEDVHQRLTDDPWVDASNIHVEVKDGEVTLSGSVEHREAKHRAERLVEDLPGVSHVQNNLRVDQNAVTGTGGRGYGSSALEAEMRRYERENDPGYQGASGFSGRTSTGAAADRNTMKRTDSESGGVEG